MKPLWNRYALILAGCFLFAAAGCALFRQPESQIATLDLSHSIQTLTAAAPTAEKAERGGSTPFRGLSPFCLCEPVSGR